MTQSLLIRLPLGLAAAALLGLAVAGCDRDAGDGNAMVMQPTQATKPAEEEPVSQSQDELAAVPVYISIDGVPHEFPPAKLWLKRSGDRVRARLLSDDPPEALDRGWSGDSFFFEMDLELPPREEVAGEGQDIEGDVTAADLEAAEWIFRSETSDRSDTRSGIFLGGRTHLQPITVSVLFDQLDERTVMVTLEGIFAEFDVTHSTDRTARRQVRVQAALPANAIRN